MLLYTKLFKEVQNGNIILHSVKGLHINIFRSILTNNILHHLEEIGHHNRIRISNPPSPPTWINVSSKQKTREGPNLEQRFSVINISAHRWWGRVHTCTTEDHVLNTMTAAPVVKAQQRLYFLRTLEKNNLAADGLLAALCWEHIDILHHWMLCTNKKASWGSVLFYSILQITNQSSCIYFTAIKSMLFGWWYNEIVVNEIFGISHQATVIANADIMCKETAHRLWVLERFLWLPQSRSINPLNGWRY